MTDFQTPEISVQLRITAPPRAEDLVGYDVRRFRVGCTYDVTSQLAALLLVAGVAEIALPREVLAEAADRP